MQQTEFNQKYTDMIDQFKNMPKATNSDKHARWACFQNHDRHDDFILDLMRVIKPSSFAKIEKRMTLQNSFGDFDIAGRENKKELDPLAFMEALNITIRTYTGIDDEGEQVVFFAHFQKLYNQAANSILTSMENQRYGVSIAPPDNRSNEKVRKAVVTIKKLLDQTPDKSVETIIQGVTGGRKNGKNIYTKSEIDRIHYIVNASDPCSIDEEIEKENGEGSFSGSDIIGVEDLGIKNIESREIILKLLDLPNTDREEIRSIIKLENWVYMKAFITRGILVALKLYPVSTNDEAEAVIEPYCKDFYEKSDECEGLARYTCKPAGNAEIYDLLKKGNNVYGNLLYKKYLNLALPNECLRDVYENFLYPLPKYALEGEKAFDFTDKMLAESLRAEADNNLPSKKSMFIYKNSVSKTLKVLKSLFFESN